MLTCISARCKKKKKAVANPKLQVTTVKGPTKYICGGALWWVKFKLDKPSPKGGIIVQEVTFQQKIEKKCPRNYATLNTTYWEAWVVKPGKSRTIYHPKYNRDDQFQVPMRPQSKGYNITKGKIKFFEGVKLPKDFKPKSIRTAGILPATKKKPAFWTAANLKDAQDRSLSTKWDCCDGKSESVLTVKPKQKAKTVKKPKSKGGLVHEILQPVKPWTSEENYNPEDLATLLQAAQELSQINEEELLSEMVEYATYYNFATEEMSKLYLVLRLLFDVPQDYPAEEAQFFGGWAAPDLNSEESVNLSWPVYMQDGRLENIDYFMGYYGVPYDVEGEFRYFSERFEKRQF